MVLILNLRKRAQRGSESCLGGNRGKFDEEEPASLLHFVGRQQKLTELVK